MALAAGLGVVDRPQAVGELLDFVELGLIGGVASSTIPLLLLSKPVGASGSDGAARKSPSKIAGIPMRIFMGTSVSW